MYICTFIEGCKEYLGIKEEPACTWGVCSSTFLQICLILPKGRTAGEVYTAEADGCYLYSSVNSVVHFVCIYGSRILMTDSTGPYTRNCTTSDSSGSPTYNSENDIGFAGSIPNEGIYRACPTAPYRPVIDSGSKINEYQEMFTGA
jgi:hypothetical protein